MRLIDADELKKALAEMCYERNINITVLSVADLIDEAPTIEPSGDLISRVEAIAYIDRVTNSGLGRNKSLEYIRKYISALPSAELTLQTPQTYGKSINPSNAEVVADYISRADAIDVLRGLFDMRKSRAKVIVECFGELLNALPSADRPQVNSAEWVAEKEKEFEELHRPKEDSKPQPYVPEASTERVVHCKDCIYSEEVRDGNDMFACNNINGMPGYVRGDDFCSSGSL